MSTGITRFGFISRARGEVAAIYTKFRGFQAFLKFLGYDSNSRRYFLIRKLSAWKLRRKLRDFGSFHVHVAKLADFQRHYAVFLATEVTISISGNFIEFSADSARNFTSLARFTFIVRERGSVCGFQPKFPNFQVNFTSWGWGPISADKSRNSRFPGAISRRGVVSRDLELGARAFAPNYALRPRFLPRFVASYNFEVMFCNFAEILEFPADLHAFTFWILIWF